MNITLERIQVLLAQKSIKPSQMYKDLGIKPSTYHTWRDRDTYPSAEWLLPIAQYLGVTTDYLLGADDQADEEGYYIDPETKEMANALKDNPGQRVLFDASRDLPPEDMLKVLDFITQQNKKEGREE